MVGTLNPRPSAQEAEKNRENSVQRAENILAGSVPGYKLL
jgi:hypothetical protein